MISSSSALSRTFPLLSSVLIVCALLMSEPALAQAFTQGIDKPVPRRCTNQCVQSNEKMVVDTAGNATAVWSEPYLDEENGTQHQIIASRYSASSGAWSTPSLISSGGGLGYHLTTASKGRVRVVYNYGYNAYGWTWQEFGMVEFVPGSGWIHRGGLSTYSDYFHNVSIGSGRNGDIFVTGLVNWESRFDSGSYRKSLRYPANGNGWIEERGDHIPLFDKIIGDDAGGAIGIQYGNNILKVMRFDTSTNRWVDLRSLENSGYAITQLEGTADRLGNVMLIYERHNTSNNTRSIRTYRFQKSSRTWTNKYVQPISSSRVYGQLAIHGDRYGNYYGAWVQYSGAYMKTISARYSGSGGVWSKPLVISSGSYHTRDAAVTNDYAGNAIYSWSQRTDTGTGSSTGKVFRQTVVRYSNATWGIPAVIQDANRNGYKPFIGAGNDGRITVLWTQDSSITGIKEIRSDRLIPR